MRCCHALTRPCSALRSALGLVAQTSVAVHVPGWTPLGAWALPFEKSIWALLMTIIIVSGVAIFTFEREHLNHDDLGPEYIHWSDRVGRGIYKATSNWTAVGSFMPLTPPGRFYSMVFAFVMLLMQSAYTANLAAFFTAVAPPVPRMSGLEAFAPAGLAACVGNAEPVHAAWLAVNFPTTALDVISGGTFAVVAAVEGRLTAGGMAPDVELNFALSAVGDPMGIYCDLDIIQTGQGVNVYAIPVTNTSAWGAPDMLRAVDEVFAVALAYGDYAQEAGVQFGVSRPICENLAAIRDAAQSNRAAIAPLGYKQLAGIFFLQGCGLVLAALVYAVGHYPPLKRAWDGVRGISYDIDDEEEGAAGPKDAHATAEAGGKPHPHAKRTIPLSGACRAAARRAAPRRG